MTRLIGAACALPIALGAALVLSQPAISAASPAPAAAQTPGKANPAAVTAGHYTADPEHTLVQWEVDHLGFTPYFGLFGSVAGTLDIDPARPEQARVAVTIPVAKVTVASAGLLKHLLKPGEGAAKPDFFGPTPEDARFVSTLVKVTGTGKAEMTGNLTFNGVTKPVVLNVRFHGAGTTPPAMGGKDNVGFEATGTLKRSEFGLDTAIPMVSDEVKLKIAAAFVKDAGKAAN